MEENPPARGTGWEPYPISLRVVNWIKWVLAGNELPPACLQSLAVQLRWLHDRLEYYLFGNHLFVNAKALVFGGCFFSGAEADRWLACGLEILRREIPEQILPDGAQFELSPMYHSLALEDMMDLRNITIAYAQAITPEWKTCQSAWWACIGRMRAWLAAMTHPDGDIGFFNDAATGIAPAPAELEAYAARLGLTRPASPRTGMIVLPDSGYIRVEQDGAVALVDVARIGPDYMPGHGHADTLSFELSIGGQRVFVNSGTSQYGLSRERLRQRGTAAHNTVVIAGENSSQVWSGFRVARRARPVDLAIERESAVKISCAHDGYRWLAGALRHSRRWSFQAHSLTVEDRVAGRGDRAAQARFHLHPDISVSEEAVAGARPCHFLLLPGGGEVSITASGGHVRVEPATWHPAFGWTVPTSCLVVEFMSDVVETTFQWGNRQ